MNLSSIEGFFIRGGHTVSTKSIEYLADLLPDGHLSIPDKIRKKLKGISNKKVRVRIELKTERIVKKHPITKGYVVAPKSKNRRNWRYSPKGRVRIRYENGGLFSVKGKVDMLVSFDEKNMFGAVVAGKYGKGKVVLIAPHPESTPPGKVLRWSQKRGYYESRLQEPLKLFGNAVRYVLK